MFAIACWSLFALSFAFSVGYYLGARATRRTWVRIFEDPVRHPEFYPNRAAR